MIKPQLKWPYWVERFLNIFVTLIKTSGLKKDINLELLFRDMKVHIEYCGAWGYAGKAKALASDISKGSSNVEG